MRKLLVLVLLVMLLVPGAALADPNAKTSESGGASANPFDVKPIPPEELVAKVTKIGENVVDLGQGIAPPVMWIAFVVAALLIFIGLPIMMFTKKVFHSGCMILVGIFIMYVLVFHPEPIIGVIKGIFNTGQ